MDDPICENMKDALLKTVASFRNHPNIVAFKKFCYSKSHFSFKNVQKEAILTELDNLNINKAAQNTDIPIKIIKENSGILRDLIFSNLNCCINTSLYPSLLKRADITPFHKKGSKSAKIIKDQLVYFQTSQNFMNKSGLNKCQDILKVSIDFV